MRKVLPKLFLGILLFISVKSQAQVELYGNRFIIAPEFKQVRLGDLGNTFVGSMRVQVFASEKISLDYTFAAGPNYVHLPPSFGLLGIAIDNGFYLTGSEWEGLLYLLIVPEGISYHIQPSDPLVISPFVNWLGLTYFYEEELGGPRNYSDNLTAVSSIGVRSNFFYNDLFVVSPSIEFGYAYGPGEPVIKTGLSLGFIFN